VASDGEVFTFGRVPFAGSLGGSSRSIIGLFSTNGGNGYTLVEANGTAGGRGRVGDPVECPTRR
jgi:hypothetical protein